MTEAQKKTASKILPKEFRPLALGLLGLVICYLPWLTMQRDFILVDCQFTYQPVCQFLRAHLLQGQFPLWNPYNYCGFSIPAVLSPSLLYPLNYILFLLPFSLAEALYMVLHQFLAGLIAYLYLDRYLLDKRSVVFASLSTMFCGYFFAVHKYPDFAASVCALLFSLWACLVFVRESSFFRYLIFVIAIFLLISSGRPEIILPGFFLLSVQLLVESLRKSSEARKAIALSFSAIAAGVILSAPLILPGYEWFKVSPRSMGLRPAEVLQWSSSWYDLVSVFFWYPFGDLERPRMDIGTLHGLLKTAAGIQLPFISPAYMGPAFAISAIAGMFSRNVPFWIRGLLLGLGILGLLFTLGENSPVLPLLLSLVPSASVLRFPIKLLIFFLLPLLGLASIGFASISNREKSSKTPLKVLLAIFSIILLAAPLCFYQGFFFSFLSGLSKNVSVVLLPEELAKGQDYLFTSCTVSGLIGVLFCIVGLMKERAVSFENWRNVILLLLGIAPMFFFGLSAQERTAPAGYYAIVPELELELNRIKRKIGFENGRVSYLNFEPLSASPQYLSEQKLPYFSAMSKFARDVLLPNAHFSSAWKMSNGYALSETQFVNDLYQYAISQCSLLKLSGADDAPLARVCSITNSELALTQLKTKNGELAPRLDAEYFDLLEENERLNVRIYKTRKCGKRIYFAAKVNALPNWMPYAAGLKRIRTGAAEQNDLDLFGDENTAVDLSAFEAIKKETTRARSQVEKGSGEKDSFQLMSQLPGRVECLTRRNSPGILVVRDLFYPGWVGTIDGKETDLFRANLLNRALIVPEGQHKVVFEYVPKSFYGGLIISLVGFSALFWAFIYMRLRRK